MKHYFVLTAIRGLRCADRGRVTIEEGEVIALPDDVAGGIPAAIEPTDEAVTVELDFSPPAPPATIASDDIDGLIAAVRNVGGAAKIIAAADVAELRAALAKLEPGVLVPAQIGQIGQVDLADFTNFSLVSELTLRSADGLVGRDELAGLLPDPVAGDLSRLSVGLVKVSAISAEAAAASDADPVGVALSALAARGEEIERLNALLMQSPPVTVSKPKPKSRAAKSAG